MPTGYTACIEDGASFEQYLWGCARGMGACVMMRDDSWDKPIPDKFEPSNWYREKLEKEQAELAEVNNLAISEIADRQVAENARIRAQNEKWRIEVEEKNRRYKAIRNQVMAWHPPTADHEGLKEFMLQQIDLCTRDCEPYKTEENHILPAEEWRKKEVERISRNIAYSKDEWNKELERVNARNKWLEDLRKSVPQPEVFKQNNLQRS